MAFVPLILRPSFVVRRNALRKGLLGPSTLWKVVAAVVFGRSTLKRFFGRTAEPLGVRTIGTGHLITVAAAVPLSRRQAKRVGVTKSAIAAAARADLEASQAS